MFIVSILLLSSCQEKKSDCPCEEPKETMEYEEVKPPEGIIEYDDAAELFKNYTDMRSPIIENYEREVRSKPDFIPTRYTEFSFKELQQYMAYIEQEAKAAEVEIQTVRIYLGTYSSERIKSPDHNTVFLVPTTEFDKVNKAFEIVDDNGRPRANALPMDFGTGLKEMGMFIKEERRQYAGIGTMPASSAPVQGGKSLVLNDGSTAPPPWN